MAQSTYLKEVEKAVNAVPKSERANDVVFLKKYIGTQYNFIGLNVPTQRLIAKKGFSFSRLPVEKQILTWDGIWQQSNSHEVLSQALLFWEKQYNKVPVETAWSHLKNWVNRIDNWAHSDSLSGFYSHFLEMKPNLVLPQLKKWNKSKNPWERRQSVVSLTHYHSKRKEVLPFTAIIPLVENLLDDKDYFVQKGVGWALREIGRAYPKETLAFLKKHHAHITGIAFSAASEKLSPEQKEELKSLRKKARVKALD